MGRMTDRLIALARRTVKVPPQREMDMLMTGGGTNFDGASRHEFAGVGSSGDFVHRFPKWDSNDERSHRSTDSRYQGNPNQRGAGKGGRVVIIAGFQGVSREREITTLGRGGSDTTAVALAAVLHADACEILTDVTGLFSADPRLVPNARLLPHCSYEEALELASLGAKMHPRSVEMARRFKVSVRIASSAQAELPGTLVSEKSETKDSKMESVTIRGIASKDGYHFFKVQTDLSSLLKITSGQKMPLRLFSATEKEVRLVCEGEKAESLTALLVSHGIVFEQKDKIAIVSAVGEGLSASFEDLPAFVGAIEKSGASCYFVVREFAFDHRRDCERVQRKSRAGAPRRPRRTGVGPRCGDTPRMVFNPASLLAK